MKIHLEKKELSQLLNQLLWVQVLVVHLLDLKDIEVNIAGRKLLIHIHLLKFTHTFLNVVEIATLTFTLVVSNVTR